jgi:hypothetical protein
MVDPQLLSGFPQSPRSNQFPQNLFDCHGLFYITSLLFCQAFSLASARCPFKKPIGKALLF